MTEFIFVALAIAFVAGVAVYAKRQRKARPVNPSVPVTPEPGRTPSPPDRL